MQGVNNNLNLNNSKNLYSGFENNKYDSNKAFLVNAYGGRDLYTSNHEVHYYNDGIDVDTIKAKKRKKKVLAVSLSALFCIAGAAVYAVARNKGGIKLDKLSKQANDIITEVKNLKLQDKISNSMTNSTNLKDDAWDIFANTLHDKTPIKFIKKWGDSFTNFYKKNVKNSASKEYKRIIEKIKQTQGGETIVFEDFDKLFNNIDTSILTAIKGNRITKNLTQGSADSKIKNFIANITSDNLANKEIIKNGILDKIQIIEVPENASEELKELIEKHNKLFLDILVPKLRDINCGSAPTDAITMALPLIGLGVGVANADNKEEKKSILFDVGFPLIGTVSMPIIGTYLPVLNGVKGIIAGFATGQVLSGIAKITDSISTKIQNKKAVKNAQS